MDFTYNINQLLALMNNFYTLTKIKTVLFDNQFQTIAAVPSEDCSFCAALNNTPEARQKCSACTVEGCRICKEKGGLNFYKCHAGLIEAVTPIRISGIIVGYMMLGQILEETDQTTADVQIIQYASEYIGEHAEMYFQKLVCKSYAEIRAAAKIMESCVCYLLMNEVIKEEHGNTAFEINRYINENLSGNLSVTTLCSVFQISRNMLYRIADLYFGMPIAAYIKTKRLEKAEQLIKEGVSVTQAAELTGFYDYGYFGKIFKSHTGKTPTGVKKVRT